jgi:[pyruvate, water dikinase]-phosphate phosphotransferase / [pyruvate, water dikinase] kinase
VPSDPVELHVVSDSSGETAARLSEAVAAQFPEQKLEVVRHPRITAVEDVHLAAARARGRRAVVMFPLVEPELRELMRALCKRYRLHYCDLLGHPMEAVARVSGTPAKLQPGAPTVLDSSYFRRIAAIEFAVRYDDGAGAHRLREADVVLVGVSRSSKTPLSMYLAYLGYKTANVPIVKGIEPPAELWKLDPDALAEIRGERVRGMGGGGRYAELAEIYDELEYAASIHKRLGCPVIEVSNLAIEETARRIVRIVEERRLRVESDG